MLNNQRLLHLMTVGLLLLGTTPTIAQSTTNPSATTDRILTRVLFKPPPGDPKPKGGTGHAGSRHGGQCIKDATPANFPHSSSTQSYLMPLVPTTKSKLTIAERPILSIYLPATSARQLVLSIREEGTIHHSKIFVPITGASGIISLQLNPDSPPLEVGKTYQWTVVLVCGEKPTPNDPAIASWVRRVAPPQGTNQGTTALEQAAWYGEQGIWYDALNSLVELRRSQPESQDLIVIWAEFLESGGLKKISMEPLRF